VSFIQLVRPPLVFSRSSHSSPVSLPIGLAYLAAVLREGGHRVAVVDGLGEAVQHFAPAWDERVLYRGLPIDEIVARVDPSADAIGVSAMFSQEWPHVEDLILALRRAHPGKPILVGGEHATAVPDYILDSCPAVDFVARGEGERVILQFAEWLDGSRPLEAVEGISRRAGPGRIEHHPSPGRMREPDSLPRPAWDLFPLDAYFSAGEGHGVERGRTVTMLATRGCPYQCTFCSSPSMWTTRYVMRDPVRVVDEMAHWKSVYGAENIDFADLTAVVKKDWILSFCREISLRGLRISWQLPSGTRSEALDEEVLDAMVAAGCTSLTYAPESGSDRTLAAIKKRVRLERMYRSIRAAKARGVFVKCNFIIGFPGETRGDILRTLWAAFRLTLMGVDDVSLYPFSPYPGSELFSRLRARGAIGRLDRRYFESLMAFMDVRTGALYCESVGPREISIYQTLGMAVCYALSYLLFPARFLRTWRNFKAGRSDSVFEARGFALIHRWRRLHGH
jgi:anaerobic magnesium-protoporphyrin IX monomethyl ester cyclase